MTSITGDELINLKMALIPPEWRRTCTAAQCCCSGCIAPAFLKKSELDWWQVNGSPVRFDIKFKPRNESAATKRACILKLKETFGNGPTSMLLDFLSTGVWEKDTEYYSSARGGPRPWLSEDAMGYGYAELFDFFVYYKGKLITGDVPYLETVKLDGEPLIPPSKIPPGVAWA